MNMCSRNGFESWELRSRGSEISQNCNTEVPCSKPTYQDANHCSWFTTYSAAESNTSVTSVNMAMWVFSHHFLFHLLYFVYIVSLIFISLFKDLMHNFHWLLLYVLILLLKDCWQMNYFKMNDKQNKDILDSVFFPLLRESFSCAL